MNQNIKLGLILSVGVLAMSSASIMIRLAMAGGAPSLVIATYRLGTATIIMSLLAARQRAWQDYAKLSWKEIAILVLSGVLLGLHFASWITSLAFTSVASSVVLVTTTPLWLGLAAPLVLGERTPRLTWLGLVAAMAGGSIIGLADWSGGQGATNWGNLLALSGAVLVAGYLLIGRSVRSRLLLVSYLWIVYGIAALLLAGWAIIAGLPLAGYSLMTVLWMVALGLVPQMIGHTAANYGVRHLSATFVGIATLGEPIGSSVLAIIFLHEWPSWLQVVGAALIMTGIVLASIAEERRKARLAESLQPEDTLTLSQG